MVGQAELVATARRLQVDAWTAEVVGAMRKCGIRPILLRGPVIARWLYAEDPARRSYGDVDLIVSPADTGPARVLLEALSFMAPPYSRLEAHTLHALPYERESDGANVDLHRTLHGLQDVPCERVWQIVSRSTDMIRVGNLDVEVPCLSVRLLHLVLHLKRSDDASSRVWQDLERGLNQSSTDEWRAAVAVARQLGAENEMAVRLRRLAQGSKLADQLGLVHHGSLYYRLGAAIESSQAPRSVYSLWALTALPDTRSRLAYVRGKLVPDKEVLLEQSTLARRGHIGFAGALHSARVLTQLPAALIAWARHYRE
ncbi:MAG TPA: nucleotidyltransferase family protein [Solirubrobacteraceae bacterium]